MYQNRHKCVVARLDTPQPNKGAVLMRRLVLASLALSALSTSALAQFSDGKIVVGMMGDQSGVVADVGGPGSILAARMAVADFGGPVDAVPVEIVTADYQTNPTSPQTSPASVSTASSKTVTVSPAASRGKLRAMAEGAQLARREVGAT